MPASKPKVSIYVPSVHKLKAAKRTAAFFYYTINCLAVILFPGMDDTPFRIAQETHQMFNRLAAVQLLFHGGYGFFQRKAAAIQDTERFFSWVRISSGTPPGPCPRCSDLPRKQGPRLPA